VNLCRYARQARRADRSEVCCFENSLIGWPLADDCGLSGVRSGGGDAAVHYAHTPADIPKVIEQLTQEQVWAWSLPSPV
jgi:hypothetical protein